MEFLAAQTPDASTVRLRAEMERFGKDKNLPATLLPLAWEDIWRELVNVGIYRRGPDIAESGSTWLESLVAMQSLNQFSAHDINQIGGKEIFFPAAWQNITLSTQKEIWGVPFRADVRVIFYWKDIFENAAVDASEAFSNTGNMTAAFTKLQAAGISPWVVPTDGTKNTVYNIASWIWEAGGDFLSPDGKQTEFGSEAARRGAQAYFDLLRFMPPHTSPLDDEQALELFFTRKAAAMVAGPWLLNTLRLQPNIEKLLPHLGITLLPGPAFVGGTILVIWKHTQYPSEAVELIRRLTSAEFQAEYCQISGLLPVRQDLWTDEFVSSHEYLSVFNKAIRTGRGVPPTALWGIVEERLSKAFAAIWQDMYLLNTPGKPINTLDKIIARHFEMLATRLDMTLSAST